MQLVPTLMRGNANTEQLKFQLPNPIYKKTDRSPFFCLAEKQGFEAWVGYKLMPILRSAHSTALNQWIVTTLIYFRLSSCHIKWLKGVKK
ncbi:hypothetical protein C9940_00995 [Pseudidiomarina aestuarii]|uniref:Uncharacterized protein n=1 Tax=Pseudidiomarina aestuarii TaxID=624146 RepID=A0A2T4CYY9_9GAMM|nr:hypothetical protein C9940_00995 [Pseudidiomarina aestuarii]